MTASDVGDRPSAGSPLRKRPRLGIAFGGGGMKGWSHVGVISVFDRLGLRPDILSGCSAGALIAAFYAFGYSLEEMIALMRAQKTSSLFSLRFDGLGLLHNADFEAYLRKHLRDCTFSDLRVPFSVVCTDLETGKEVVVDEGPVVDAVLASSAIPGVFPPVEVGGRLLVDGGLSNNVPVSALVHRGADFTIAVRLHQEYTSLDAQSLRRQPKGTEAHGGLSLSLWSEKVRKALLRENVHLPNGMDVLGRAMEIVISQLESYRLNAYKPDILITPRVAHVSMLSFWEEKEDIFQLGVSAAEEQSRLLEELSRRVNQG